MEQRYQNMKENHKPEKTEEDLRKQDSMNTRTDGNNIEPPRTGCPKKESSLCVENCSQKLDMIDKIA